ncbi:MAG: S10 family peptidase [Fimbriimonadales bacterium]
MSTALVCAALVSLAFQGPAQGPAQGPPGQRSQQGRSTPPAASDGAMPAPMIEVTPSVTKHTITLPSGAVAYTATAAQIPIRSDTGEVECRMFCVSYEKDDADAHTRPVTFAFNGGPGSATFWLHMGALGPKRAPMNDDGSLPAPPYQPVENMDTWLDFTDVVVVDAPGTGLSRIAKPELATKYFGLTQDIAAFTQFVRNWLTVHHRWRTPLFVAGESYGGIRGSGLSASLFRAGIAINGFVSISGTSNFMTLDGMRGNDITYMSFLPSMAACAWYHHKLNARFKDPDSVVKEVEGWMEKEYASALERGDSLSEAEKSHVADKLAEYLGISKAYILGQNLRISEGSFFSELLRSERLQIGRYDGRLTGKNELAYGAGGRMQGGPGDPSDDATTAPFTSSINDYLLEDLKLKTDLPYLNSGNVRPWQEPEGSYGETAGDLRNLLGRNQHFRVLYCMGYFDLACPIYGTIYTVNHMGLDPETRSHVSFQYYPAGHMMYIEKVSRHKLHEDVKAFEAACLK